MEKTDELFKLIELCKSEDRNAQKKLYNLYSRKLFALCYRYSKNEAEDILQISFIKIFKNINKYEGTGSFEGWIKRITVNTAITEFHKKNVLKHSGDILDYEETSIDENNINALSQLTAEELLNMINDLPDIYRVTFNLYAIEGYKHHEIAEMLNISEGTSKSHISRARKMLQDKLTHLNTQENGTKYA